MSGYHMRSRYKRQEDPIVSEVRKVCEELAKQANYDLHKYFENLRNNAKKRKWKTVKCVNL